MSARGDPAAAHQDRLAARFSATKLAYLLGERRLGRLATADGTKAPHVVPVAWSYNADLGTIDISGRRHLRPRLRRHPQVPDVRRVRHRRHPAALSPRCVMVQGTAQALDAEHSRGTEAMIRIVPEEITSWGADEIRRRRRRKPPVAVENTADEEK